MPPLARFTGVDFSVQPIIKLTPALSSSLGPGFRCLRPEFVTFWRRGRILREENASVSRCWLLEGNGLLAGYITLLADKLKLEQSPLANEGVKYRTMPAVKIGLLAADLRAKGAGLRLVDWAIEYASTELAEKVGVRFMTVDAFYDKDPDSKGVHYDASGFYEKIGFAFVDPDETLPPPDGYRTMYLDLKPMIDAFQPTSDVEQEETSEKALEVE